MRYWQHGETGTCCAVIDDIDLSRSHFEITKDQYDLHEGAKNTEQLMQNSSVSSKQQRTIKECNMTAYENLKRKEKILSGASLRARAPDMKVLWYRAGYRDGLKRLWEAKR